MAATTTFLSALLSPLPLTLLLVLAGLVLMLLRRRKAGAGCVLVGLALLVALATEPVARALLAPLESRYPPLSETRAPEDIRWVVVLGANASGRAAYPATTRLSGVAALRLMEGLRLHHAIPESRLVLSGGTVFGDAPSATVMSRAAVSLGADPDRIIIHPGPRNTYEEMGRIYEAIGDERFIMVTSASHMPRAMMLARRQGLDPVPATTARRIDTARGPGNPTRLLPSANALAMSERAIYEYLGILWSRVRY